MSAPALALAAVAASVVFSLPPVPFTTIDAADAPDTGAATWILYDATNDVVLSEFGADDERAMASVTKVMTALVVRERTELSDLVEITAEAAATGEAEIGLVAGELWTVQDLLAAIMVRSGNDAAVALAEHVGGSVAGFATIMNAKAAELGLEHTRFANPHGLDEDGHYSSARDLLVIAEAALDDPVIARLARTKVVKFRNDPSGVERIAENTNELLGAFPGVVGMKTGFTSDAGRVLIATAEQNGRMLVSVVMGSEDHFFDSRQLLVWGFDTYGVGDRWRSLFLEPSGGGGAPIVSFELSPEAERRLRMIPQLPTPAPPRLPTPLEEEMARFLQSNVPATLGGT